MGRALFAAAVAFGTVAASPAQAASPNCATAGGTLVQFPSPNPVWEFCLLTPGQSSGTNGSGVEIREAFFNGHKVLKRAHIPILNVKYTASAPCVCYRDWFDQETKFEVKDSNGTVVNMSGTGHVFDNASSVRTVCDAGGSGGDIPTSTGFSGVAIERFPNDKIVLTSQTSAGWYRYESKWTFFSDGRILPQTGYAALPDTCVLNSHHHNSYFRLDFDIDDPGNDAVGEAGTNQALTESGTRRPAEPAGKPPLKVYDEASGRGYHVVPHGHLGGSYDPFGGPSSAPWNGSFTIGDAWLLQYKSGGSPTAAQIDDGLSCCGSNECPIGNTFLGWSNNESLDGQDVVVWYHEGATHKGGQLDACARSGATLEPFGDWAP